MPVRIRRTDRHELGPAVDPGRHRQTEQTLDQDLTDGQRPAVLFEHQPLHTPALRRLGLAIDPGLHHVWHRQLAVETLPLGTHHDLTDEARRTVGGGGDEGRCHDRSNL